MALTRKSAQKLAKKLLDSTFKGMSQNLTFTNAVSSSYNTTTGEVTENNQVRSYSGIYGPFNSNKFEVQDLVAGDAQFIVAATKVDIDINNETNITDAKGNTYRLINRFEDAAGATLTLQLRAKVRS